MKEIRAALEAVLAKPVPKYLPYTYCLGSVCLFLMANQLVTGSLLCFYYHPVAAEAHESVRFIQEDVRFGWLIRQLHAWGANLMILALVLHAARVVWHAAYRAPRAANWLLGVLILGVTVGLGFTGYLLPWDQLSYWASRVGTEIPAAIPVVGHSILVLMRAGEEVGPATLSRFFALHVIYLPAALVALVGLHLVLMRVCGISTPAGSTDERTAPFFPHHAAKDMVLVSLTLATLYALVVVSPWELGPKADPLVTPEGIKPEWYFLWAYQLLKYFPMQVGPVSGKSLGLLACALIPGLLVALPLFDRGPRREPRARRGVLSFAALLAALLLALTLLAGRAHADAPPGSHSCRYCHEDEGEAEKPSVHFAKGVTCESCHGGDPKQPGEKTAMDPARGYRGKLSPKDVVEVCASCHKDERGHAGPATGYRRSVHARSAMDPNRVAPLCTDCHGVHDVKASRDPTSPTFRAAIPALCDRCHGDPERMNPFGLAIDPLAKYRASHHGRAVLKDGKLGAAVCTDCHGAHEVLSPKDPQSPTHAARIPYTCGACHAKTSKIFEEYKTSVHGRALLEKGAASAPSCVTCHGSHSAVPPGFRSVATVCGSCHPRNQEAHARSPHTGPQFRGCVECHGNHQIERPGPALFDTACGRCHPAGSPAALVGGRVRELLAGGEARLEALTRRAAGLATRGHSNGRLRQVLKSAQEVLFEVRPELHALTPAALTAAQGRLDGALLAVEHEAAALEESERWMRLSFAFVTSLFLMLAGLFHLLVVSYEDDM